MGYNWIEYAQEEADRAARESGKQLGMFDAYKDMAEHLDSSKYCQMCGYQYGDGSSHYRDTKEVHDREHEQKQE